MSKNLRNGGLGTAVKSNHESHEFYESNERQKSRSSLSTHRD